MARYKNRRTKYSSSKHLVGQKRFENQAQKRKTYLLQQALRNKERGVVIEDKPIPLIDIGIERINELIKTVIDPNLNDFIQATWERILNSEIIDEDDVLNIAKNIIETYNPNNIKLENTPNTSLATPISDEEYEILLNAFSAKRDNCNGNKETDNKYDPKTTTTILVETDPYLVNNSPSPKQYRLNGHKICPKCGSNAIIKDCNDTICLTCGLRGYSQVDIVSLIIEAIIKWLIRNKPSQALTPPRISL